MKRKSLTPYLLVLLFVALISPNVYSQDCKPTIVSDDGTVEYFGGKIRDLVGILTDDKSAYSFYIIQMNKGKEGTFAYVSFYEPVNSRNEYNNAINDYLNEEKLKASFIEIQANNMVARIQAINCILEPKTTLGDISGYSVNLQGNISKEQIMLLQNNEIQKFKVVIGGKPYERTFNRSTKITQSIRNAMKCVNIDNMFEIKKRKPSELDLTEIESNEYSAVIIGKWLAQNIEGLILEFTEDKIIVNQMGHIVSEGTYKIAGTRLIYTGETIDGRSNNGVSNLELFLKDMIILKDKGQEITYERIE